MGRYTVTTGQNIYDVALHIYGSVEGIVDLLMSNPALSVDDWLHTGQELIYSDDYLIDEDVSVFFRTNGITPAGGERQVYPKEFTLPLLAELLLSNAKTSVAFAATGRGNIEVDWGDNAAPESIALGESAQRYTHTFDSAVAGSRRIRLYGDAEFRELDLSAAAPSEVYFFTPLRVEKFTLRNCTLDIGFLQLLKETYMMDLQGLRCPDLRPLAACRGLMTLDLRGAYIKSSALDVYLLHLVRRYGARRNCRIYLPYAPGGDYTEPQKDINGAYIPENGMEAIWIITHEEAWNEAGSWEFIIDGKTYTYEPND